MPTASVPAHEVGEKQRIVRNKAKCLRIFGYILFIGGIINIVCNVFYILDLDSQSLMPWYDTENNLRMFQLDQGGLFFFALVKIVTGYMSIRMGKGTLKIVKPLLKEYKAAMSGQTQGI